MADTEFQPTIILPTEEAPTDAEENFIDETPPNVFPENQDSNWGYKRKVFSDVMQDSIDQLDTIYVERFVDTSTDFIDDWEEQMLVPYNPAATLTLRRNIVKSRIVKGAFSRQKITSIIEKFLIPSAGAATQLTPDGVTLDALGATLYGEGGDPSTLYRVYENPPNFSYDVWIVNSTTPDIVGLTRELTRITPAGITFTVDNSHSNILDYFRQIRSQRPNVWWRLGDAGPGVAEAQGFATYALTPTGGVTFANAGLLTGDPDKSLLFSDASISYIRNASVGSLAAPGGSLSIEAWIRPTTFPTGFNDKVILWKPNSHFLKIFNDNTKTVFQFDIYVNGAWTVIRSTTGLSTATTYYVCATYDGARLKLYVNGVLDNSIPLTGALVDLSAQEIAIGGLNGGPSARSFNGAIDEVAIYGYPLLASQVLRNYNTGKGIL